jgi:hypothetical protein
VIWLADEDATSVEDAVECSASVALGCSTDLPLVVVALDCLVEPPPVADDDDEIPIVVDLPSSTTKIPDPEGNAEYTTPDTVTTSPPADGKAVPPMMYGESPLPEPEIPCSMY